MYRFYRFYHEVSKCDAEDNTVSTRMMRQTRADRNDDDATSMQHRPPQLNRRHCAALRIQSVFRGWRTRQRVVWSVRDELSAFMSAMEQDVEVERLVLGLPKPQTSRWLYDEEAPCDIYEKKHPMKKTLHIPRIDDIVFGWTFSFPPQCFEKEDPTANIPIEMESTTECEEHTAEQVSEVPVTATAEEVLTGGDIAAITPRLEETPTAPASPVGLAPQADVQINVIATVDYDTCHSPAIEDSCLGEHTASAHTAHDGDGEMDPLDTSRCSGSAGTSASSDSDVMIDRSEQSPPPLRSPSLSPSLTVDDVLRTYSKAAIQMELAWAKQTLSDRLRYLSTAADHRTDTNRHEA